VGGEIVENFRGKIQFFGDRSQLSDDDRFEKSGLAFNTQHQLLICTECGCEIGKPLRHLQQRHKSVKNLSSDLKSFLESLPDHQIFKSEQNLIDPVQGLTIIEGYRCYCGFLAGSEQTMKNHQYQEHGELSAHHRVFFQQFLSKKRIQVMNYSNFLSFFLSFFFSFFLSFFLSLIRIKQTIKKKKVHYEREEIGERPDLQTLQEILKEVVSIQLPTPYLPMNLHQIPPFFQQTNLGSILNALEDGIKKEIWKEEETEKEISIRKICEEYWEEVYKDLHSNKYLE